MPRAVAAPERSFALALSVLLLAGCQGLDTTPVPLEPTELYLCEGIPARGMELALGGDVEARSHGAWHTLDRIFSLLRVEEGPRDPAEDAERLLLSTLGWACGDQDPPPATR